MSPRGVVTFASSTDPSPRNVHVCSCVNAALFEPVTSTTERMRTDPSGRRSAFAGRGW